MNFSRKQRRKQLGGAVGQLSQAVQQVAGINHHLKGLPELITSLKNAEEVLDTLTRDNQTLRTDLRFQRYLLSRVSGLTPELEDRYRLEFEAEEKGRG